MNIYVLLAIALSAFSGVADLSATRAGSAQVVSERGARAEERAMHRGVTVVHEASPQPPAVLTDAGRSVRPDAPLTGSSTPRAPAVNR